MNHTICLSPQTSNTISWSLYLLARDPAIQEQLYQEVISVCPKDSVPNSDDIAKMPFLKAVIRETLRSVGHLKLSNILSKYSLSGTPDFLLLLFLDSQTENM